MSRFHVALTLGLALAPAGAAVAESWRYVVPKASDPFAHPPLRVIALGTRKPVGLKETARYRGSKQRYARLVYGSGRTAPVTVVVDEIAPDKVDLYVDAGRAGEITGKDRVAGAGLTWRTPLKAVVHVGDEVKEFPRTICFRYGPVSRTLAVATCGYIEGKVQLGGKTLAVRRTDGDANGLFADAQDRVWLDSDGSGAWDSATSEYLFAPILRVGEQRVAVRADAWGLKLALAPLEGSGKLKLALPGALKPEQVREVVATFQSKDGVVATIRQPAGEVTVPVGDYRVSSLLLTLEGNKGEPKWGFVFGDNGGKKPRWHKLARDATLALDPVGKLAFSAEAGEKGECQAGESLTVRPALYTGDGLLIERAYRGPFGDRGDQGCSGLVNLMGAGDRVLGSASSGFA
jgi:hypothetical protein